MYKDNLYNFRGWILFLLVSNPCKFASCLYIHNWCIIDVHGHLLQKFNGHQLSLVACDCVMFGNSVFEQFTERYIPETYNPNQVYCLEFDSGRCVLAVNTSGFKQAYIHFNFKLTIFYYNSFLSNCTNRKHANLPVGDSYFHKY